MDYQNGNIRSLFFQQLIPSLLGMLFTALFIIVDGMFVGRGIGSHALAALNIVGPIFTIITGIGLMFGTGSSILATIALSKGKRRLANTIATQSFIISALVMLGYTIIALTIPDKIAILFGATPDILEDTCTYLMTISSFSVVFLVIIHLPFFVRISSPKFALMCMVVATASNFILDYLFIFVFKWGVFGAAFATGLSEIFAAVALIIYLTKYSTGIRLVKLSISLKGIRYAWRNTKSICYLGFAILLSEFTISLMAIAGNKTFTAYIGVDGVAAFSIINYIFPVVYMVFNAIAQSAQPIISYNYGNNNFSRYKQAFNLAIRIGLSFGLIFSFLTFFFNESIINLFIPDNTNAAWQIAANGFPYFAVEFLFFGINVLIIGYFMSVKESKNALICTLIRGVMPILSFIILPLYWGEVGIWLATPVAEIISCFFILLIYRNLSIKESKLAKLNTTNC